MYNIFCRKSILAQIRDMKHFSEKDGKTFIDIIDEKYIYAISETDEHGTETLV